MVKCIEPPESECWFAIRVKSNREKVVVTGLLGRGYETFCPTYKSNPGSRAAERPLFAGYVFSRFNVYRRLAILMLPGVVHIVGSGKTPLAIDEEEMESLRLAVESRLPITPVAYSPGEKVQVQAGPLAGATGTVSGQTGDFLMVSISLLQRSVAVEMRPEWLANMSMTA